jgi:hypothetical protein
MELTRVNRRRIGYGVTKGNGERMRQEKNMTNRVGSHIDNSMMEDISNFQVTRCLTPEDRDLRQREPQTTVLSVIRVVFMNGTAQKGKQKEIHDG